METETRRAVDPGILEHVEGNTWSTRIFPIPAKGSRKARLTYLSRPASGPGGFGYVFPLPLGTTIPLFHLSIAIDDLPSVPRVTGFASLEPARTGSGWSLERTIQDTALAEDLRIRLPEPAARQVVVENVQGEKFLLVEETPDLPGTTPLPAPARVGIAWDASGSRDARDAERDRGLLAALFKVWKDCDVEVVVFRDRPEPALSVKIRKGEASALLEHLARVALDGATDLSALDLRKGPSGSGDPELWLLFTDGLDTLGAGLPALGTAPVSAIVSGRERNVPLLRQIANVSGGTFVDLSNTNPLDAAAWLTAPPALAAAGRGGAGGPDRDLARIRLRPQARHSYGTTPRGW